MSDTKLANRIVNAERSLRRLEEAAELPLDERRINLDATVHRFNTAFETLLKALDTRLQSVHRLSAEERGRSKFELLQAGFRMGLIDDDRVWTRIRKARNATVHEYDLEKAMALYREIKDHVPHLRALLERIRAN
ncbi:MAG: HI0074 family nucleotidyltransferase substrate-binding subunit [Acidobacteriota bacterium]|nr:HI0074 family nucleotidyltransferase substrate-binding subunit [Acidobacteriota bacterium]MDE3264394.1 HI0074 family nucleotidyltransferase substrate-binding subunit [Acidobacteriota bacterium]